MTPGTGRQAGQANIANADTDQLGDGVAQCGEHAANLTVTALKNRQLDFRLPYPVHPIALMTAAKADILCRLGRAVFKVDAPAQDIQGFLGRNAADLRSIGFRNVVARVGQTVQELPVVSQEDQAFRVNIQPADRAQHGLVAQVYQIRHEACSM